MLYATTREFVPICIYVVDSNSGAVPLASSSLPNVNPKLGCPAVSLFPMIFLVKSLKL